MELKIQKLHPNAEIPQQATAGAAGIDLRACCDAPIVLQPMQRMAVPTGLAIELPNAETVALVFARSGMALKQGLAMANGVGVIDSDYRGEVAVLVVNLSSKTIKINHGERIAQLVCMPVLLPQIVGVDALSDTERGQGGFGSTGVK
ncbi:dUTP diphosphatase [Ruminococcaceae bacterium OttesenSCG-928-A16]|nr:dUTP diphosphatase [Ruminococcaceae bacterium OttesenSCG-928-A16]